MIKLNFPQLINDLLPSVLRTDRRLAWLNCLINTLKYEYVNFLNRYNENIYLLKHNGQVASLENLLNNRINLLGKPIYIDDGDLYPEYYISSDTSTPAKSYDYYTKNSTDTEYYPQFPYIGSNENPNSNTQFWVTSDVNETNVASFIIYVDQIDYSDINKVNRIKFYTDKYRVAGYTYIVKPY